MFCPKCGSLMTPVNGKYVCPSCGYEISKNKETIKIVSKSADKETIMIKEEVSAEPLDSDAVCPRCHHKGARYVLKQTRSADEPETKFYTCEECGYRWREY
ncbi:probable transcription-associated protein TFIIS [Thermoplasma acidophilum]|uniref:Transcription factor S n=1 Tax=Thermoplasma acidophilum (strain ATCC 25905 / DSM 1728 / JCM 9062 / NBRC 15155 / AMRC-C165) TaxID=273075 RepID=Q9HJG3_THEAC|nr:transcription factor S [Thermoplasma acidophilum]CAC12135.1 probable transcription-associated protein TFIIS [Thermoplasma acidophilum]